MPPFVASLWLVILPVALSFAVLVTLLSSLVWHTLGATGSRIAAALGSFVILGGSVALLELRARIRAKNRALRGALELDTLAQSSNVRPEDVGGAAATLAAARRLGISIPDTVILTHELVEQWIREV